MRKEGRGYFKLLRVDSGIGKRKSKRGETSRREEGENLNAKVEKREVCDKNNLNKRQDKTRRKGKEKEREEGRGHKKT